MPELERAHARKNDIGMLAFHAGMLAARVKAKSVRLVKPQQWKGSRPKEVDNRLTMGLLSDQERRIVAAVNAPPSLLHNVIDAIGIGLWAIGRR